MNPIQKAIKLYQTYGFKGLKNSIQQKFIQEFWELYILPIGMESRIKHIYGPTEISYDIDELIVISWVRNGELYIKSFMEHYRKLGIKHFIFMDNVSTDRTLEMLCSYDCVTVLQTDLSFRIYENPMRRYLAQRFSQGRWNLVADMDELFDYPYSNQLSLRDFLGYLNANHYTAVIAQMLDLFSAEPLAQLKSTVDDSLEEKYPYYDISNLDKTSYDWSTPANPQIQMHWGGIRKTLFNSYHGLTKAALILMDDKIKPFVGWHHAKNAQVADISCVLKHYQFLSSFYQKVKDAIEQQRYAQVDDDFYLTIQKILNENPDLNLKLETAQYLSNIEQLIDQEFIAVSKQYCQWVETHNKSASNP